MPDPIETVLKHRGSVHGPWAMQANLADGIKALYRASPNWPKLSASQREALDMHAVKVSRILTGDPKFLDHWVDIEGYTRLVIKGLRAMMQPAGCGGGGIDPNAKGAGSGDTGDRAYSPFDNDSVE